MVKGGLPRENRNAEGGPPGIQNPSSDRAGGELRGDGDDSRGERQRSDDSTNFRLRGMSVYTKPFILK